MAQTPGHILQNAFGDIRVEFITRDLQGGVRMEVVNKGHWGVAQILEDILLGSRWVIGEAQVFRV